MHEVRHVTFTNELRFAKPRGEVFEAFLDTQKWFQVSYGQERLKEVVSKDTFNDDPKRVAKLIADLDSKTFTVREQANKSFNFTKPRSTRVGGKGFRPVPVPPGDLVNDQGEDEEPKLKFGTFHAVGKHSKPTTPAANPQFSASAASSRGGGSRARSSAFGPISEEMADGIRWHGSLETFAEQLSAWIERGEVVLPPEA